MEANHMVVCDLSGAELGNLSFPARVVAVRFANHSESLFALTARQDAITLRLR
jgi:hypothetical protein